MSDNTSKNHRMIDKLVRLPPAVHFINIFDTRTILIMTLLITTVFIMTLLITTVLIMT